MNRIFRLSYAALLGCLAGAGAHAAGSEAYEGRLTQITGTYVTVDGQHSFTFEPRKAKCFDPAGAELTCETLVGVGYADRARLTVIANAVRRIDVIELQQ